MKVNIKSDCRGWDVESVTEKIFEDRGIESPEDFMTPKKEDMLPLTDLKNIEEAAQIVLSAIEGKKHIGIVADVDLDGITSCSIVYRYLKRLGADLETFINHGKLHGLHKDDLEKYKECDLLIIVDSLDATAFNYEAVQMDSSVNDVIVLDHHTVNPKVPYGKWVTLVSSQVDYANPELSGAGVCMKFVLYLDSILGVDYAEDLYDLAAAGIVGDMMNVLVPENRYIISRGLEEIHNPAIQKLNGGFGWDSKSISFSIAPAVNASMRLDKNEYSLKAFLSDDNKDVLSNVRVLKNCKEKQNEEIDEMMPDILAQADAQVDRKMIVVMIKTDNGIAGLIGNKILERYKRPIVVLKEVDDSYVGSMRAVGVEDFQALINESGLGKSFGHPLAASCEVKKKDFQKFLDYMEEILPDVGAFEETMDVDVWVDANDVDRRYIECIQELNRISGTGFPAIRFYLDGITDFEVTDMSKGKHLVINLADSDLKLIKWNFNGDWDTFTDASLFGDELEAVVQLQCGFIGRNFMLQGIVDYIGVKEG